MRSDSLYQWLRYRSTMTIAIAVIVVSPLIVPSVIYAQSERWVGTWSAGSLALDPPPKTVQQTSESLRPETPPRINDQTIRQIVHTSIGGSGVRVALTNLFGTKPLRIGAAHIALRNDNSQIVASTGSHLTFGGHATTSIEAGSTVLSDPIDLAVPALGALAIDLYLPDDSWETTSPVTIHSTGLTTNYVSPTGNHAGATNMPVETTFQQWFYMSRVEVLTNSAPGAIVILGDSITDGTGSTPDTNRRWTDFLARRLVTEYGDAALGVMNVGIAGNRVLSHNAGLEILRRAGIPSNNTGQTPNPNALFGPSGLSRFDREVLLQPGVTHVIVLETTNDIGMAFDAEAPTVDDLIAGHRSLIQRAHAHGLKIYAGTLTPFEGAFYWTETGEEKRQSLNEWIRTSGAYDAVIDFDAVIRDANVPTKMQQSYHPGDWLHPNDEGYRIMADTIDLSLFVYRDEQEHTTEAVTVPRTPWGAPDLTGVWDFRTITPLERPEAFEEKKFLTPEEAAEFRQQTLASRNADRRDGGARRDVERAYNDFWWDYGSNLTEDNRTSLIVDPPNGRIPSRVAGVDDRDQARRSAYQRPARERVVIGSPASGPKDLGLSERCILGFNAGPPLQPSAYNNNAQIFQTPDHVVLLSEMVHEARVIPLNERPQLPDHVHQWLGNARGHWDDTTLVIESTNFSDKTGSFDTITRSFGSGETLRLVERLTPVDHDNLMYEFTVDDPMTFTQPFTAKIPMRKTDAPLSEYACHEGSYGMTNLLTGARAKETNAKIEQR